MESVVIVIAVLAALWVLVTIGQTVAGGWRKTAGVRQTTGRVILKGCDLVDEGAEAMYGASERMREASEEWHARKRVEIAKKHEARLAAIKAGTGTKPVARTGTSGK